MVRLLKINRHQDVKKDHGSIRNKHNLKIT